MVKAATKQSIWKRGLKWMILLLILGVLCFCLALGILTWAEKHTPAPQGEYDAIIVLGAQVLPNGKPNVQLELRLEQALSYYQEHPTLIISCGAQGSNEPAPEGDVMRAWLIERGVDPAHAISETNSYNTWQNLKNAKALLPENAARVIVVTSDYHLPRALQIAKDLGLEADGLGSPILPLWWFKNHAREVLAWCKYFAGKVLPLHH